MRLQTSSLEPPWAVPRSARKGKPSRVVATAVVRASWRPSSGHRRPVQHHADTRHPTHASAPAGTRLRHGRYELSELPAGRQYNVDKGGRVIVTDMYFK